MVDVDRTGMTDDVPLAFSPLLNTSGRPFRFRHVALPVIDSRVVVVVVIAAAASPG